MTKLGMNFFKFFFLNYFNFINFFLFNIHYNFLYILFHHPLPFSFIFFTSHLIMIPKELACMQHNTAVVSWYFLCFPQHWTARWKSLLAYSAKSSHKLIQWGIGNEFSPEQRRCDCFWSRIAKRIRHYQLRLKKIK
jgi:hypothetical protein